MLKNKIDIECFDNALNDFVNCKSNKINIDSSTNSQTINLLSNLLKKNKSLINSNQIYSIEILIEEILLLYNKQNIINDNVTRIFSIFFSEFNEIVKKNKIEHTNTSCNFNTLKYFYFDENLHSRLLKMLLNPKEEHGQGNIFLVEFLKLLNIEEPTLGEWIVTAEKGRIDVLLKRKHPESIIIIENKSNGAYDQPNQLYRYWYQEIYLKTKQTNLKFYIDNSNKYKIIYMSPNENKLPEIQSFSRPNDNNWKVLNLPEIMPLPVEIKHFNEFIIDWLNCCLIVLPASNYRMIEYVKQYIEICRNL